MRINYQSDFDFILHLRDQSGRELPFPDYDFRVVISTCGMCSPHRYVASKEGERLTNCKNDEGRLRVICDNHQLPPGRLNIMFEADFPNSDFPDGKCTSVTLADGDIYLVRGRDERMPAADIEATLQLIKGDRGEKGEKGDKGDPFALRT